MLGSAVLATQGSYPAHWCWPPATCTPLCGSSTHPCVALRSTDWCTHVENGALAAQAPADGRGAALDAFPLPVPAEAAEVEEPAALEMLRAMRVCAVDVPAMGAHVQTAYVTNAEDGPASGAPAALHCCSMYALIDLADYKEVGEARLVGLGCVTAQATRRSPLGPSRRACRTRPQHARERGATGGARHAGAGAPLLLLHGFDSSLLEFRRLFPRLAAGGAETWAVDLAGATSTLPYHALVAALLAPHAARLAPGVHAHGTQRRAPCCHACWACSWSPC